MALDSTTLSFARPQIGLLSSWYDVVGGPGILLSPEVHTLANSAADDQAMHNT